MNQDLVLSLALPVTLFLLMFSMGTTLQLADFRELILRPRKLAVGLSAQLLLLPLIAVALLRVMPMSEELYVGFIILALSPGGTTSNLFSYLSDGNVALSIALTAVVSVIAPFSLPVAANWLLADELATGSVSLPVLPTVLRLLVITLLPLTLGMVVRARHRVWCRTHERALTRVPFVMLLLVIAGIVHQNWDRMPEFLAQTTGPALILATAALGLAYAYAKLALGSARDARTVAIETSIQNGGTAMLVTGTILQNSAMTVAPIMYGILMLVPMFSYLGLRKLRRLTA